MRIEYVATIVILFSVLTILNVSAFSSLVGVVPFIQQQQQQQQSLSISTRRYSTQQPASSSSTTTTSSSSPTSEISSTVTVEEAINELKKTLQREYASFFSPMEREFYASQVTFDDPLTNLVGIDAYQTNVNMLSGKNIMGKVLFKDANIVLHNIVGGEINNNDNDMMINDIITRWTLRMTIQILPWQPTARFSGISIYNVVPGGPKGVQIIKQTDYWDSINIVGDKSYNNNNKTFLGGSDVYYYKKVDKSIALMHFLHQLKPNQFTAPSVGNELPYELLRCGKDYEVRRYPTFIGVETKYERRDEGFSTLGTVTKGVNPLSPALMMVSSPSSSTTTSNEKSKSMIWPLAFQKPGSNTTLSSLELETIQRNVMDMKLSNCKMITIPEQVVAIGSFSDASVEPIVRKADKLLREACQRDGLQVKNHDNNSNNINNDNTVTFAQYDAIYSMGKRRGEVWIELDKCGHPW